MQFVGFPTVEQMHAASESCESAVVNSTLNLYTHVLEVIKSFGGRNAIPRVVCHVLTREYLLFTCRDGHDEDRDDMYYVYDRFRSAGFYCEHADSDLHRKSNTSSLLICWSPKVIRNAAVRELIDDNDAYNLYLTVMRYISVEEMLPEVVRQSKDVLTINGAETRDWISLPIITTTMYNEAVEVGHVLWRLGYYVGIRKDNRREETWTMFVCWDKDVSVFRGDATSDLEFRGQVPSSWK